MFDAFRSANAFARGTGNIPGQERRHNPTGFRPKPGAEAVIAGYAYKYHGRRKEEKQSLQDHGTLAVRIRTAMIAALPQSIYSFAYG